MSITALRTTDTPHGNLQARSISHAQKREQQGGVSISLTGATVENSIPPLSVFETQVNKQHSLITTNSQMCKLQTMANINNMIRPMRIITREYRIMYLTHLRLRHDRGGITFSTLSPVKEILVNTKSIKGRRNARGENKSSNSGRNHNPPQNSTIMRTIIEITIATTTIMTISTEACIFGPLLAWDLIIRPSILIVVPI